MDGERGESPDAEVGAAANPEVGAVDMGMIPTAWRLQRVAGREIPSQDALFIGESHRAHHGVSAGQGEVKLVT